MSQPISRHAQATWKGTVAEGGGEIALGSGALKGPFTLHARVADVDGATNPEELMAAASAGCFTMSLSSLLTDEGTPAEDIQTTSRVRLEQKDDGFRITRITLTCVGRVPGVDAEHFTQLAERAKSTCPVSLALTGTEILLDATLEAASAA
jgi:osmotically inducible protein OsmC